MDYPPIDVITNGLNRTLFCPRVTVFEGPSGNRYSDRYSDASATWVVAASILIFFMKTGFLFIEVGKKDGKMTDVGSSAYRYLLVA